MGIIEAAKAYDGDVILYSGSISRNGYDQVSNVLEQIPEHGDKVCFILVTTGGDPAAGYRISRALSNYYEHIDILIPDICKSAGTLMCIGANRLIFGDRGELGPLDIQLSKPDELFESMSGLSIVQAISNIENETLRVFDQYLMSIRGRSGLRTKIASDLAVDLTKGIITPIVDKIDPVTLGEHVRAMQIANDYGDRLNSKTNCLKPGALNRLIGGYPDHGFVIDRREARELFVNVVEPDNETSGLYFWVRDNIEYLRAKISPPLVINLNEFANAEQEKEQEDEARSEQVIDQDGASVVDYRNREHPDAESARNEPNHDEPGQARDN